jgi:hypothetical protein
MAETQDDAQSTSRFHEKMERFDAAHAEWLMARADLAIPHEDDSDEAMTRRTGREEAAELALATVQAPHSAAVWSKWSFIEHLLNSEIDDGPSRYPLVLVALAGLKADIIALGLNYWPRDARP